jgi:hypothetical protein
VVVGVAVAYDAFVGLVRSELLPRLGPVGRQDIVAGVDTLMRQEVLTLVAIHESENSSGPKTYPEVR